MVEVQINYFKVLFASGKSISEVGITPDIIVEEDDKDFLINSEKDNQLNYAIELFNSNNMDNKKLHAIWSRSYNLK